ncbi:NUDIX hydrolase [Heyndrickxia vini]|uniref:NUDIX domain-containing protein n=1 Tax=Heyndrickxia vini TaxID=1476025 RepID=A0ABX7E315_9BACI|nr:NUDIX domain-containing protein [Heyndrickxia vini]QQZ08737.1 NUDIX domain-containing protein [Heyndrickxia vini]
MTQNGIVLVVSVSIIKDGKVLLIKENKPSAKNKWNFPSGHIENKEDIRKAACREVKEETGYEVKLNGTTGIYNFISDTNDQVILFHFTGEIIGGSLNLVEDEIVDSKWINVPGLIDFNQNEFRNAGVIKQIISRLQNEQIYSLEFFNEQIFH